MSLLSHLVCNFDQRGRRSDSASLTSVMRDHAFPNFKQFFQSAGPDNHHDLFVCKKQAYNIHLVALPSSVVALFPIFIVHNRHHVTQFPSGNVSGVQARHRCRSESASEHGEEMWPENLIEQYRSKKKLSAEACLEGLTNAIHTEGLQLTFDYFSMHRLCWTLLDTVKEYIADDLRNMFGPEYLETESQLPLVVGCLVMAAFSADKVGKKMLPPGMEARSNVFARAAESVQTMLMQDAGDVVTKMIEKIFNYAVDWEEIEN